MDMPPIAGVYAAALTPRRLGAPDINLGAMWELIDFLGERKVDGLVLFGTTGEFIHYGNAERMRVMGLAPKRSRVPVLVNVSHSTLDGAVELAQAAAASGSAGVLLMPPYFYRYSQDTIREFYVQFADQAGLNIPTLLYNIPQFGNRVETATFLALAGEGVVQGLKDSSGDLDSISAALAGGGSARSYAVFSGDDRLILEADRAGADGCVSGVASALPELLTALRRSTGGEGSALHARLCEFLSWSERLPFPVCIREAAAARGLKLGPHASPLSAEQRQLVQAFGGWFKPWLQDVLKACKHA